MASDKIDWLLLHGIQLKKETSYHTGGEDASDHSYLWMDLELSQ
jgi:hypothetical protein